MIIYRKTAAAFLDDVDNNLIVDSIKRSFIQQIGWFPVKEVQSWNNSMRFMESVIRKSGLKGDCGVLIEYGINSTRKRIDFAISGLDGKESKNLVIVELKQWETATATKKDSVVVSRVNQSLVELTHPSYQAYSYKTLLVDFYENFDNGSITPHSCAYLHNYEKHEPEPLESKIYEWVVADSPMFFKHDTLTIQKYIRDRVGYGNGMGILEEIEKGKRRPTKKLIEHVCNMFKGNKVFTLIDNQKIAFENALALVERAKVKTVLIVKGGPGTGKSVVSVNLLGALLGKDRNVVFVAPNAAFRDVMVRALASENKRNRLNNLFHGSSSFHQEKLNAYDALIVDEAHRLKDGTAYQYRGKNQVEDVIKAGFVTVLFIDEAQRIRPEDIGSVDEIKRAAKKYKAKVQEIELDAQYRCAGAEGFVNWVDDLLQIRETANFDGWDRKDFEFKVFDDPNKLHKAIKIKQKGGFSARMLAGYAWKWTSESDGNADGEVEDVHIPELKFKMPWNSRRSRTTWAVDDSGIDQVGCIHTSQGLEFDYVGVIIGPDLGYDLASNSFNVRWENYKDSAGKKGLKKDPERLSRLVRNIYKTLMSRALKGCYVFICDPELNQYVKARLNAVDAFYVPANPKIHTHLLVRIEEFIEENLMFTTHLPVYSIQGACGKFGRGEQVVPLGWIGVHDSLKLARNMFVVRAVGTSMVPKINDGNYVVFRTPVVGTRQGKIVLVQHHGAEDPDYGGAYTIKKYSSRKTFADDGAWQHEEILLKPLNNEHKEIVLSSSIEGEFTVVAEFVDIMPDK